MEEETLIKDICVRNETASRSNIIAGLIDANIQQMRRAA
jgi:hypothetical protein